MANEDIQLLCSEGNPANIKLSHLSLGGIDMIAITDTIDGEKVVIGDDEVDTLIAALLKLKTQFIYN